MQAARLLWDPLPCGAVRMFRSCLRQAVRDERQTRWQNRCWGRTCRRFFYVASWCGGPRCEWERAEPMCLAVPATRAADPPCSSISSLKKLKPSNGFPGHCCFPLQASRRGMCSWVIATKGIVPCWSRTSAPFTTIVLRHAEITTAVFCRDRRSRRPANPGCDSGSCGGVGFHICK